MSKKKKKQLERLMDFCEFISGVEGSVESCYLTIIRSKTAEALAWKYYALFGDKAFKPDKSNRRRKRKRKSKNNKKAG